MSYIPSGKGVRIFSFGGGRQSMAVMVMQAQGLLKTPYDAFVFANVGKKAENPDTLDYFEEIAKPYALNHGINLIEIERKNRVGNPVDLYDNLVGDNRSVPIPVYMSGGAPGNRTCTTDWKIRIVDKWVRGEGFDYAVVALGISIDEIERMRSTAWTDVEITGTKKNKLKPASENSMPMFPDLSVSTKETKEPKPRKLGFWKRTEYPLIDARMSVAACSALVINAGLPAPPKSSCWFCPFRSLSEWLKMRRENPSQFAQAVALEKRINEKRITLDRDTVYLHRSLRPLEDAVGIANEIEMSDECGGYCHT